MCVSKSLIYKSLLSLVNSAADDCFTNNSDTDISKNSSLSLKDLSLLFIQFNDFFVEQKTNPENVVNSNYHNIDQLHTLIFPEKINCYLYSI